MNIGFVGLGRMGANMARRLKDRGFHVTTLFDANRTVAAIDEDVVALEIAMDDRRLVAVAHPHGARGGHHR